MNHSPHSEQQARIGSMMRGVFIAVLVALFGFFSKQPEATFTVSLLIAAGLQLAALLLRKFVPTYLMPQAIDVFELCADGLSVLLFALGVFGGMAHIANIA